MRHRKQRRGGKGLKDIRTSERNGQVVGVVPRPRYGRLDAHHAARNGHANQSERGSRHGAEPLRACA